MIRPGGEDPRNLGKSESDHKTGMIDCVIRCMIR